MFLKITKGAVEEKGELYVVDSYNFNIKMFIFWNKSIVCFSELSLYFKMIMKKIGVRHHG